MGLGQRPWLRVLESGVSFELHVQPGARDTGSAGMYDGVPRVRVAARAREDAANDTLCRWIAGLLRVTRSSVTIASGHRSRRKRIVVTGDPAGLAAALIETLDANGSAGDVSRSGGKARS